MDYIGDEQSGEEMLSGMVRIFEDVKDSLKNFNKKNYPGSFQMMKDRYRKNLLCIEEIYNHEDARAEWLGKLTKGLTEYAGGMIQSQKWKFQREKMQIDCNIFVIGYLIPLILEFQGNVSEPFADAILESWNETFGTQMTGGTYEQIYKGFRSGIFGISFGKEK